MNTSYIFICLILVLWLHWLWKRRKYYLLMLKIPGPLGYPLLGMSTHLMRKEDILPLIDKLIRKYGPTITSFVGPYPFMLVCEPSIVQEILTSNYCVNKSLLYDGVDDGIGKGLFSLKVPEWNVHRKLLNPAFNHKILMSFVPIFNSEVNQLLKKIEPLTKGDGVDLVDMLQKFTLNIATKTTMGKAVSKELNDSYEDLLLNFHIVLATMADMFFSPWLRFDIIRRLFGIHKRYNEAKKKIREFIGKLIEEKLNEKISSDADNGGKNIFIDLAIDLLRKGDFSFENVQDQSLAIVFGAFETTANTVAYTLMLLAMFPEYQDRAFEELLSIFPNQGDFEVTYSDIQNMTFMDMLVNESMRVLTPVPAVIRQTTEDFKLSNGIVLPKGLQIAIDMFHMHRREDIWGPDAKLFNPNNFLPSNLEDKHPYAFIPFTKGIRNCIGWRYALMSIKISLAKLLRNYYFTTDFKYEDLELIEDITIKFKRNPLLRIEKRKI